MARGRPHNVNVPRFSDLSRRFGNIIEIIQFLEMPKKGNCSLFVFKCQTKIQSSMNVVKAWSFKYFLICRDINGNPNLERIL